MHFFTKFFKIFQIPAGFFYFGEILSCERILLNFIKPDFRYFISYFNFYYSELLQNFLFCLNFLQKNFYFFFKFLLKTFYQNGNF